ncbi:MAG: hypothetical protein J6A97_00170 [Clostridia bacterium]|nr:hypothetical protein [Clostridia bacterium]
MDDFLKDQIINCIRYLPHNIIKSYFIKPYSEETIAFRKKTGFIRGVSSADEDYDLLQGANIEWVRESLPAPFNKDGSVNERYTAFKEKCLRYKEHGIKVMGITPLPNEYLGCGIDIREKGGEEKLRQVSRFIMEDVKDIVGGLQIANELGMPRFMIPYNMKECIRFLGVQMEEMYPLKGDCIIGYNSAGPQVDLHLGMKPYLKFCDYVGMDMYLGCFFSLPGFCWLFDVMVRYLWAFTGKPVLMQEFGYIGGGKPKTRREKDEILKSYGFESEKEAKKDIMRFVESLPEHFCNHVKFVCGENREMMTDFMFSGDMTNHLYKELPRVTVIPGMPHTPEGQAKFFRNVIPRLYKLPFMCGAIIYCYSDFHYCGYCGQHDCPTETMWGLVDTNKKPKPSYYAVKEVFRECK